MSDDQNESDAEEQIDASDEDDRINFKVYDMPLPLVREYISIAKMDYDNEVWRVLADALELLKEERQGGLDDDRVDEMIQAINNNTDAVKELFDRIEVVETKVETLEAQRSIDIDEEKDDGVPPTFGDAGDGDNVAEKLKSLRGE